MEKLKFVIRPGEFAVINKASRLNDWQRDEYRPFLQRFRILDFGPVLHQHLSEKLI